MNTACSNDFYDDVKHKESKMIIIWNSKKCVGCRVCEAVCSLYHEGVSNPMMATCKIIRTIENAILHKIRVSCMQCEEAKCMSVCPTGAISENSKKIKIVNEDKCIGCRMCEIACPVGAIHVHPDKMVSMKCDLCNGLDEPQCVKYCYSEALQYIPAEGAGMIFARAKSEKFLEMQQKEVGVCHTGE